MFLNGIAACLLLGISQTCAYPNPSKDKDPLNESGFSLNDVETPSSGPGNPNYNNHTNNIARADQLKKDLMWTTIVQELDTVERWIPTFFGELRTDEYKAEYDYSGALYTGVNNAGKINAVNFNPKKIFGLDPTEYVILKTPPLNEEQALRARAVIAHYGGRSGKAMSAKQALIKPTKNDNSRIELRLVQAADYWARKPEEIVFKKEILNLWPSNGTEDHEIRVDFSKQWRQLQEGDRIELVAHAEERFSSVVEYANMTILSKDPIVNKYWKYEDTTYKETTYQTPELDHTYVDEVIRRIINKHGLYLLTPLKIYKGTRKWLYKKPTSGPSAPTGP